MAGRRYTSPVTCGPFDRRGEHDRVHDLRSIAPVHWRGLLGTLDFGVLFFYRLLVGTGQLDGDLFDSDLAQPGLPRRWFERIGVGEKRCTACASCRMICPSAAIRIWERRPYMIDATACLACVSTPCIGSCPTGALVDTA